MEMDKVRTTIYLEESASNTAKRHRLNLSKFVNDQIYAVYGEQHSLIVIRKKLKKIDQERSVLEKMAGDLKHEHKALRDFAIRCVDKMHTMPETFKNPRACVNIWDLVIKDDPVLCTIPTETIIKTIEHELNKSE